MKFRGFSDAKYPSEYSIWCEGTRNVSLKKKKTIFETYPWEKIIFVCLGINGIPENIGTLTANGQKDELSKARRKINSVIDYIKMYHPLSQIVFATIPQKTFKNLQIS